LILSWKFNSLSVLLIVSCCYAGQFLAFEEFQRSAAACGNVAHLIAESKLVNCSCGVAAADNGGSVCLSQSFGNCDSAFCKNRVLEYAHRSVPYNCLGCLCSLCVCFCGLRSDIQSESVCRNSVAVYILNVDLCINGVRERLRDSCICGKKKILTEGFSLGDHFLAVVKFGIIYQGSAY